MIKEVIVVEGRDDVTAIKKAVEAEVIAVGGFGINYKVIERIKEAQKRQGVIVFTDPDHAGEKIRKIISKRVEGIKHAYISREEGLKGTNIGVENASSETIRKALAAAKYEVKQAREEFTIEDIFFFDLTGSQKAKRKRELLCRDLRIGYCNSAQFITRLNNYGITKEEFIKALKKVTKEIDNG